MPGFIKSRSIGFIAVLGMLAAAAFGQNQNARGDGPASGQEAAQVWAAVQQLPYAAEGQGPTLYVLAYSTCPYTQAFYNDWHGKLSNVQIRWVFYPVSAPATQDATAYVAMTHDAGAVDKILEHRFTPPSVRSSPQLIAAHDQVSKSVILLNQAFARFKHAAAISPTFIWHHGDQLMVARGYEKGTFAQLILPSLTSGAAAATTAPATSAEAAAGQAPLWKIHPPAKPDAVTDIHEATLPGTAEAGGTRGATLFVVRCTVHHFTAQPKPSANLDFELRMRRSMVHFATDGLGCEGDNDGPYNQFTHLQLGSGRERGGDLCYAGELPSDRNAIVSFTLDSDERTVKSMAAAQGDPLKVRLRVGTAQKDDLVANFQHAQNGAALMPVVESCLQGMDDERKAEEAAIVVSCPDVPGKALSDVDVLVGPAMKKLPGAADNDIGGAWDLPKITPQHPTRPKLTLSCSYTPEAAAAGDTTPEKKLLPIPNGAAECTFRYDHDGGRRGICSRKSK